MLETIKFEKLKKKYALNNSYFKNRQHSAPSTPFEVLEYFKEHNELPYNSQVTDDWFYQCFVEYQKRSGVHNQQFFTPTKTADRIAEIVFEYAGENERILDACCGFGQITMALQRWGYREIEAFDNDKQMVDAFYDLTGINARHFSFLDNDIAFGNKYNFIVANPPYDVKELTEFLYFIDEHLTQTGKAILLVPSGFLDKTRPAILVQILNKFYIEKREPMSEKFERTGTSAEIVVLSKGL